MALFDVENLGFGFDGEPDLFSAVEWQLKSGECFCILGPGGEGKSVLLRLLVGLLTPTRGSIQFDGKDLMGFRRPEWREFYRRVGFAFQRNGLFDSLSCGDNLRFPLRELLGLSAQKIESRVLRSLADVGLEGQENLRPSEMSGGMQKRLGMARALALEPQVIFFDEPTAGLDPLTSRQIFELMENARKKYGMTVVVSTSDPVPAFRLGDRIGFLYEGKIVETGTAEHLRQAQHPALRQFLSGADQGPLTGRRG